MPPSANAWAQAHAELVRGRGAAQDGRVGHNLLAMRRLWLQVAAVPLECLAQYAIQATA